MCARVYGRTVKRGCELEERRGSLPVRVAEGLPSLDLPAPRTGLENKADAASEEITGPDIQVGVQQPEVAALEVVFVPTGWT